MGAGVSSCASATAAVNAMRYAVNKDLSSSVESALPDEVGIDLEFSRRARQLAKEDELAELQWCWDDELTRHEGISLRTSHYVKEALGAGTLGQVADAHRVLWEECEHDSESNGGPVSHALLWAMEVLLGRHAQGDFEDGFHAAEGDVGENLAYRLQTMSTSHQSQSLDPLDQYHVEIRKALAHESPADIEAVVRRAWTPLKYKAMDDFDDSDDGDDLALRALLWIGKILRARDGIGNTWAPRRALEHCEGALATVLQGKLVRSGRSGSGGETDTGTEGADGGGSEDEDETREVRVNCFALIDETRDALACARRWLRPARKVPAAGCSAESVIANLSAEAEAEAEATTKASLSSPSSPSLLSSAMKSVMDIGSDALGAVGIGEHGRNPTITADDRGGGLTHIVTIRTAALEIIDGGEAGIVQSISPPLRTALIFKLFKLKT